MATEEGEKERERNGNSPRRGAVANDEEEEPEDREKTRSRRRHYPRWVAGRRDAAISTYRLPRLPAFPALFLSLPSTILFLFLPRPNPPLLEHKERLLGRYQPFGGFSHLAAMLFRYNSIKSIFKQTTRDLMT